MNKNSDMKALSDNELDNVTGGGSVTHARQKPAGMEGFNPELTGEQVDNSIRGISELNGLTGMLYYTIKWIKQGFSFDGLDIEDD